MKQKFFTGLVIIFPIVITLMAVRFIVRLCTAPLQDVVVTIVKKTGVIRSGWWIFTKEQLLQAASTTATLVAVVVLLLVIGMIGRWVVSRYVLTFFDRMLLKLPLIGGVYKACRDFTDVLFSPQQGAFSQVAWCPFPSQGQDVLGFVTNEVQLQHPDGRKDAFVSLLIPGVPNPTVGFLVLFRSSDISFAKLGVEAAVKWTMSLGVAETSIVSHDRQRAHEENRSRSSSEDTASLGD